MTRDFPGDSARDAVALVEAVFRDDDEAIRLLLDEADLRDVVMVVASVARDVLIDLAAWHDRPPADLLTWLRDGHARP